MLGFCVKMCSAMQWKIVIVCFLATVYCQIPEHDSCTTPDGQAGHCIPIQSCSYLAALFEPAPKPLTPPQVDALKSYHCGFHGTTPTPKVCCPHAPVLQAPPNQDVFNDKMKLINQNNCGGKQAALAKYPWMALLAYNTSSGISFKCGGSLINENYILTAAQCLTSELIAVRLGEYDTSTDIDCYGKKGCAPPVQDLTISEVVRHRGYNPRTMEHDIGLIRLSRAANVQSETVRPICLPLQDDYPSLIGKYVDITGWGVTETGFVSSKLLKVSLPILSLSDCQQRYAEKNSRVTIGLGQLCAGGYHGKDACSGDGGGPLGLQDERGIFTQHGIVSFGSRFCGIENFNLPGVYTNVAKYTQWILNNIRS